MARRKQVALEDVVRRFMDSENTRHALDMASNAGASLKSVRMILERMADAGEIECVGVDRYRQVRRTP